MTCLLFSPQNPSYSCKNKVGCTLFHQFQYCIFTPICNKYAPLYIEFSDHMALVCQSLEDWTRGRCSVDCAAKAVIQMFDTKGSSGNREEKLALPHLQTLNGKGWCKAAPSISLVLRLYLQKLSVFISFANKELFLCRQLKPLQLVR